VTGGVTVPVLVAQTLVVAFQAHPSDEFVQSPCESSCAHVQGVIDELWAAIEATKSARIMNLFIKSIN
jgi:hypothetical protein